MKADDVSVIYFYNNYLLNDEKMPLSYIDKENAEQTCKTILKYVFEHLLRWSPAEVEANFNLSIVKLFKLDNFIYRIEFPLEYDIEQDLYYFAHYLYPSIIKVNKESAIIKHYEEVLQRKRPKFKKGFLEGDDGRRRIQACLRYLIEKQGFTSSQELYQMFTTKEAEKLLKDNLLANAKRSHYKNNLDFLHESLPESSRNNDYYHYYKFKACDIEKKCKEM